MVIGVGFQDGVFALVLVRLHGMQNDRNEELSREGFSLVLR